MRSFRDVIVRFPCRFVLFYWVCFLFPFPLDLAALPFQLMPEGYEPAWFKTAGEAFTQAYLGLNHFKHEACTWVAHAWLDLDVVIQPTGSGDTLRNYIGCMCAAGIALALTILWSLLLVALEQGKARAVDAKLHAAVRMIVRFFLFQILLSYGIVKVFPLQFPEPTYRLTQNFGDLSPMGLLWAFMGFSAPYQMFTGAVEILGGLLLTTRRSTPLGAIVIIVAMTQVVALNFCFDVPVKLYSLHYLAMAIFLLAPDLPRIWRVLVLHQAVEAAPLPKLFNSNRADRAAIVLRTFVVAALLWAACFAAYQGWDGRNGGAAAPARGRWELTAFLLDGRDPGTTAPTRWTALDFSIKGITRLYTVKPPALAYKSTWDAAEHSLTLGKFTDPKWAAAFAYEFPQPGEMLLKGTWDGKNLQAHLKQAPDKKYELTSRGFHWIQELPYNR